MTQTYRKTIWRRFLGYAMTKSEKVWIARPKELYLPNKSEICHSRKISDNEHDGIQRG